MPLIQLPASCAPTPNVSAKVELGGLGCGIRDSAEKGGVSIGTTQATALGLGRRVPFSILPRPHPKSQHPGITHRAGRPAPGGSPPHPAPPHPPLPEDRKTWSGVKTGCEKENRTSHHLFALPLLPN